MRRTAVRNAVVLGAVVLAGLLAGAAGAAFRNPDGVAVIIGNRAYKYEVPEVTYAHRDAEAFRRYVVDVLGFDPKNVIFKLDADKATLEGVFGNQKQVSTSELWSRLPRNPTDVVVFYSGHGMPGLHDRRGYLLPVNAHPDRAELNGYAIDVLYQNLGKLKREGKVQSVHVFLDACFSGDSGAGPLFKDMSAFTAAPPISRAIIEQLTILTAASGKEVASWDKTVKHGLFTHHLLDALHGEGDANGDGQVTAAEAKAYLDKHMTGAARRLQPVGRIQNAELRGVETAVLAWKVGGRFPERLPGPDRQELALEKLHGDVQTALRGVGFDPGPMGGQWSEGARGALEAYRRVKGMPDTGEPSEQLLAQLQSDRQRGWHNRTCRFEERLVRPESCPEACREVQKTHRQCDDDYRTIRRVPCNPGYAARDRFEAEEICESDRQNALNLARAQCRQGKVDDLDLLCDCGRMGCSCEIDFSCIYCENETYYETVCPDRCPQRTVKQKVCECKAPEFCN